MKKLLTILLVCLMAVSMLAGCGGNDANNPPADNDQPQTGNEGQDAAEKTLWEQIQEAGVITVGNSPDYEPYEYEEGDGTVVGFDIDLLDLICQELGIKYELVTLTFENIETAVQTGQVNVGMSGLSVTPERQQTFDFTTPYFSSGQAIAVNPDSGYTTIEDLAGKKITAGMGTTGMDAAQKNIPDADVIGMDNYALAFMQLKNKGCDAAVADLPVVQKYAAKDGFTILEQVLSYEDNAILVAKGNEDLVEALNGAIATLKENGKIDELTQKWMVGEE
ncbi:MAG: basic amino acid ABC transporter substrate-binding protein [Peptococcaceae bacterium]|nr:basic amino acid ABC transporter substrate-binding protein [Peptococcaceae bacterium]